MPTNLSALCALGVVIFLSDLLHAQEEHGHADDATIGFTVCVDSGNRLGAEFDADEVFELPEVDGVLVGWAGDEPGFNTLEEDEPEEGFFALAEGANVVLEVVSLSPGFKAHTPGFADILDAPGETWELGAAPFDTHPEWHIDPADPGFDDHDEVWTVTVRLLDTGSTGYAPSEPFSIQFAREEDEHGHADDATIGFTVCVDSGNRLGVEFDADEVFELPEVDGVLVGWAGDEPGFNTLEEDEPEEGFFALAEGANVVLEVVSLSPGFKAHTPGFADILDAPGETWELGAAPFDTHPEWHIDPADPGFDSRRLGWHFTVRLLDTGTTAYRPSEEFTILFTNADCHEVDCSVGQVLPGDFNVDSNVDISDAVGLLGVLFLGQDTMPCAGGDAHHAGNLDLLDWNADSELDVSDAVGLLSWAFRGESPHALGTSCRGFLSCPSTCVSD